MRKILIYGLGNVGRNLLFYLSQNEKMEIGIISSDEAKCKAMILDLLPFTNNIKNVSKSDLSSFETLIVTAGIKDESNRLIFIKNSKAMIDNILTDVYKRGFKGNVIIVSNPTDVLSTYAYINHHDNFKNILSTGTLIDSLRLKMISGRDIKLYGLHGKDCVSYFEDVNLDNLNEALDIGYEIQKLGFNSSFGIVLAIYKLMNYLDGDYNDSFIASIYNSKYNASFSHDLVIEDGIVKSLLIDEENKNFIKLKEYINKVIKEVN